MTLKGLEREIEVTSEMTPAALAGVYQLATGRRLGYSAQLPPLHLTAGRYSSAEFVSALSVALESVGLRIAPLTDSLDFVSSAHYGSGLLPSVPMPPAAPAADSAQMVAAPAPLPYKSGAVVVIHAEVGALRLGTKYESGVDFLGALDRFAVGQPGLQTFALGAGVSGGLRGLQLGSAARPLSDYIKALDSDSDYSSFARPRMEVVSGGTARIATGQRVAVPTQSVTTFTGQAATSSNIDYKDVQLSMEITPHVLDGGKIALRIVQSDDSISGSQTISGNTVPTIASQTFSTETVVNRGDTIALGGIRIKRTSKDSKGVRGLRRVPLLGRLFGTKSDESTDSELVILVTCYVLR